MLGLIMLQMYMYLKSNKIQATNLFITNMIQIGNYNYRNIMFCKILLPSTIIWKIVKLKKLAKVDKSESIFQTSHNFLYLSTQ